MAYLSVAKTATLWGVSERSVRNYCVQGRVKGAMLVGNTWRIPENATKPQRANQRCVADSLLNRLQEEQQSRYAGGIYHRTQIDLTYNSNHMEGSRLTHEQTRYIFETNTIGIERQAVKVDDIVETVNHFRCVDYIIEHANAPLSEAFIKTLHQMLKTGTSDARKRWFAVGDYKRLPNEVGGKETTLPEAVAPAMKALLTSYAATQPKSLEALLAFHVAFEQIHPFQDGNGRVGRLILFKECLKHAIVPFIIDERLKLFYYRGLQMWDTEKEYLLDTCLTAQDNYKALLNYFRIPLPQC